MEFINETDFPHLVFRTSLQDDVMACAPILRVTFNIEAGKPQIAEEQTWTLNPAPYDTEYGKMDGDFIFQRDGVDLFVFGNAVAPRGQATQSMTVAVSYNNKLLQEILVIGNRKWSGGISGLYPSEPEYFTEMPVGLKNAYGGWTEWDGLKFPYAENPQGKGFIWEKEYAAGIELPNVENPNHLIKNWNDRPEIIGICQANMSEKRLKKSVEFDKSGTLKKLHTSFFNQAYPEMVLQEVKPKDVISIKGMHKSGLFEFMVPENKFLLDIDLGHGIKTRELHIDQIGIEPNKQRAFVTYRYPFNYKIEPKVKRIFKLYKG